MSQQDIPSEIDYSIYNFKLSVEENGLPRGEMSKTVNIYSYANIMLCEVPIYEVNKLVSDDKNATIELNITDKVDYYQYILVNVKDSSAYRYKDLKDEVPIEIDYQKLDSDIFSFNEQVINIPEGAKKKVYNTNDLTVEEYLEEVALKSYVTKLIYSEESRNSNFSFSSVLETSRDKKLQKIHISEKEGTKEQIIFWELHESTENISQDIINFLKENIAHHPKDRIE
ncbi:hypothetical protein PQ465_04900 [Sphingobacterium oryzagri]|uniref:Uncharacterized protein n=1 Tax=Sphingobacterium oryzagri TaxID=3025669 RepID=A0ABY7WL69_9SPHI|nr:hypothetical protein [Sphingobacterium sp. KACC 22765]WDF69720.1 hypothetical protein PQ465_04900 [Sphingobacterium sp. KACC 22765]